MISDTELQKMVDTTRLDGIDNCSNNDVRAMAREILNARSRIHALEWDFKDYQRGVEDGRRLGPDRAELIDVIAEWALEFGHSDGWDYGKSDFVAIADRICTLGKVKL